MDRRASGLLFWRVKNLWVRLIIAFPVLLESHLAWCFLGMVFPRGGYDNNKDSGHSINFFRYCTWDEELMFGVIDLPSIDSWLADIRVYVSEKAPNMLSILDVYLGEARFGRRYIDDCIRERWCLKSVQVQCC
jgi:hypothetical protein